MPTINTFNVSDPNPGEGKSITFFWDVSNAASIAIYFNFQELAPNLAPIAQYITDPVTENGWYELRAFAADGLTYTSKNIHIEVAKVFLTQVNIVIDTWTSHNDGKEDDTELDIMVKVNGAVIIWTPDNLKLQLSNYGKIDDGSVRIISVSPDCYTVYKSDVVFSEFYFNIRANGKDTWNFDATATMIFSDGSKILGPRLHGGQLTQDNDMGLPGLIYNNYEPLETVPSVLPLRLLNPQNAVPPAVPPPAYPPPVDPPANPHPHQRLGGKY